MSSNRFRDGVGHIEDHLLERYDIYAQKLPGKKRNRRIVLTAIAACIAVLLAVNLFTPRVPTYDVPTYDDAIYSAEDIANLFSAVYDGASTNAYQTVYVPSAEQLNLNGLTNEQYAAIFQYVAPAPYLDRSEFSAFAGLIIPNISDALGIPIPEYTIKEQAGAYSEAKLDIYIDASDYWISLSQTYDYHYFSVFASTSSVHNGTIALNDQVIQVDQTQTNEEILKSLSQIKQILFDIFDVRFADAKIVRVYNSYSKHGATQLYVYFYNEADHPLNAYSDRPVSDYISIHFDNFSNYANDIVSDSVLTKSSITYIQYRADAPSRCREIANAKLISLEEAELLLKNGYVFGGHACRLCMEAQNKVDFENYDYVEFTYITGYDSEGNKTQAIPFYAFYKYIGTSQNGNESYAYTYVPAIEVSGLKEYFESQTSSHNKGYIITVPD